MLILALLASSESYRQSRGYKGRPRSYKRERECNNVMDCVEKKLCQTAFPFVVIFNNIDEKCNIFIKTKAQLTFCSPGRKLQGNHCLESDSRRHVATNLVSPETACARETKPIKNKAAKKRGP